MKTSRSLTALVTAIALIALPALAAAQEPVRDFAQLNTRLRPGDTVWVTDAQGREAKGTIFSLGPEALTLEGGGARTFGARDVSAIQVRRADSLRNGALIGMAAGGGLTLGFCLADVEGTEHGWCAAAAALYAGIGAGIGVGIDAVIPGKKILAYRAPGAGGAPHARLSIAPLVSPRAKGAAVSFSF